MQPSDLGQLFGGRLVGAQSFGAPADGPVFAEPWEAQAFAMAVRLSETGAFTWSEWAQTLGAQIKTDPALPYYQHWLAALETLVTARGLCDTASLDARKSAWEQAYRHTPHGMPVEL